MPKKSGKLRNNFVSCLFSFCGHKFDASLEPTEYRKDDNIDLKKKILGNWLFLCFDKKRWTFA
jgi:hypothetical protein